MFSSTGIFRDISCPYFIHGLCDRPYCHFKHSRSEEAKVRKKEEEAQKAASKEDVYTVPTSTLQKTLANIEQSIKLEKKKLHHKPNTSTEISSNCSTSKTQPTGTPRYNPTPLHELEKNKLKGKSPISKYDIALSQSSPTLVSEYDPASNFSTLGCSSSHTTPAIDQENGILPDYMKTIKGIHENEDDNSVLNDAKIPVFVSVDYTPSNIQEFSDDDSVSGKQEISENESEKSVENNTSVADSDKTALFPAEEFTAEGYVKNVKKEADTTSKKKVTSVKSEPRKVKKTDKKDNIFNLFKEEFDSELNRCEPTENGMDKKTLIQDKSSAKVELKRSSKESEKSNRHENLSKSNMKGLSSSKNKDDKKEPNSSLKEVKRQLSSHSQKHYSSKDNKSKTVSSSSKLENHHSHSDHSSSKHKNSDSKSHRNKDHTKFSESVSKHKSSSSSSSSLKNGEHSVKKHHSSGHSNKSHHCSHKEKHRHEDRKRRSSHSSERSDKHSDKHKSSKEKDKKPVTKKKRIANLDVDLFGNDSDNDMMNYSKNKKSGRKTDTADLDLDSDLEKYFSDEDPFDECLRIFNEQPTPSTSSNSGDKKKSKKTVDSDVPPTVAGKKRVALKQDNEDPKRRKVEPDKPKPKPSPAQVMMNRYKMMQERALQAEEEAKKKVKAKVREISEKNKVKAANKTSTTTLAGSGTSFNAYLKSKKTTAITATKGQKRKAHTPTVAIEKLKRPVVEVTSSSKVGANIRQRYLNLFIDECLKLCPTEREAFDRGKEEEENVYKRCTNKKIYLNICVNTIKRLRNEVEDKKKKKEAPKAKTSSIKLSHSKMLDGAHAKNTNYTVNRSGGAVKLQEEDFLGAELYKRLKPYILTEEQLKANNFPRSNPEQGGTALFFGENFNKQKVNLKGYEKLCIRCGRIFEVYPNGKYPVKEDCVYHWGKAWKKKIAGSLETRYTCCSGDLSSDGCQVAKAHVHETNKHENFTGYMKTIPCSPPIDGDYGVYALDCEMVYTTMGQELARVTVVGGDAEPVYESLVKPDNAIVDFNTRFSGITEDDMEDVHTSLRDVQAVLLSLFTDKTILMGHSLESDLMALKLIHSTVVDTSIVFPHRLGLPYKRALRNLMSEYLKKIIQDDVGGHDSLEDAVACIELMQFQLKEDARKEARRVSS